MRHNGNVSAISYKFGRVIRSSRTSRGLSQEALAEFAGLSRSYLGRIEHGAAAPSIETMCRLADALGENLSYLISLCESECDGPRD